MNALAKAAVTGVLASFLFGCAAFTVQSEVAGEHVVNGDDIALGARGVRESLAGGGKKLRSSLSPLRAVPVRRHATALIPSSFLTVPAGQCR